jgi:hypothetical protein
MDWVVTKEAPKEVGYYWVTVEWEGQTYLKGLVHYWQMRGIECVGCWPVNAVAYMKVEQPEPYQLEK